MYTLIPLELKLPILSELLKVKDDNFVLNNIVNNEKATMINFLYLETILYLIFFYNNIVPLYFCVRNKSIIIIYQKFVR